jgi:hypothetical protein
MQHSATRSSDQSCLELHVLYDRKNLASLQFCAESYGIYSEPWPAVTVIWFFYFFSGMLASGFDAMLKTKIVQNFIMVMLTKMQYFFMCRLRNNKFLVSVYVLSELLDRALVN